MSLWGRAAGGIATAAVNLTNRYIDAEMEQARMQAVADIQRKSANLQMQDADAFANDPTRVARNRASKVADIEAVGDATNAVHLKGKRAEALDPELAGAEVARAAKITTATAEATGAAQLKLLSDPAERERRLARAGRPGALPARSGAEARHDPADADGRHRERRQEGRDAGPRAARRAQRQGQQDDRVLPGGQRRE